MENNVVSPVGLLKSTSKYGNNSVAAGTSSMVPITACAAPAHPSTASTSATVSTLFMRDLPERKTIELSVHRILHAVNVPPLHPSTASPSVARSGARAAAPGP